MQEELVDKWPSNTSLLTSKPIKKKKIAISPSLIHKIRGLAICKAPNFISTGVCKKAS